MAKVSAPITGSLSLTLPEVFFLDSYLNYQDGEEDKTGFLPPNDVTQVSLEEYDDYRLNRIQVFQFLLTFFTDMKYPQISDGPIKFCQLRNAKLIY